MITLEDRVTFNVSDTPGIVTGFVDVPKRLSTTGKQTFPARTDLRVLLPSGTTITVRQDEVTIDPVWARWVEMEVDAMIEERQLGRAA